MYKYLFDGKKVNLLGTLDNGKYLVANVVEVYNESDEGWEEHYDDENGYLVDKVYAEPPKEIYDEEIQKLNTELISLRSERDTITNTVGQFEAVSHALIEKLSGENKVLTNLLDFIDGKITHYVLDNYSGVKIIEFSDINKEFDSGAECRMLSLFGHVWVDQKKCKTELSWKLNEYSDGSGSNTTVHPCLSYENALRIAQEMINKKCERRIERNEFYDDVIKCADEYGLKVPEKYTELFEENKRSLIKANFEKAKTVMEEMKQSLLDNNIVL